MSIKIASFNIRDFSTNRKDIDFLTIAKIITEGHYDIVAIQEVLKEEAITFLVNDLNRISHGIWKTSVDKPEQGNPKRKEGFAFLWDERKIELAKEKKIINGKLVEEDINPYIINDYKSEFETRLERNPLYGRFWPKGEDYSEIRLIDIHIKSPKYYIADRNREFIILADSIYHKYCSNDVGSRTIYTIMLGDYNLNLNVQGVTGNNLWHEEYVVNDNGKVQTIRTVQDKRTTHGQYSEDFVNNFDHFSYDEKMDEIIESITVNNTVKKYMNGNFKDHFDQVSDHIPIEIVIDSKRAI